MLSISFEFDDQMAHSSVNVMMINSFPIQYLEIGTEPEPSRKNARYSQFSFELSGKIMPSWVCYIFVVIFSYDWANRSFWDIYWIIFGKTNKILSV